MIEQLTTLLENEEIIYKLSDIIAVGIAEGFFITVGIIGVISFVVSLSFRIVYYIKDCICSSIEKRIVEKMVK